VSAPHEHSHGRGLTEIRQIISAASISETAKKTAIRIFESLGRAEAKIHNTSVESIHFHEVGAVDAMVDIVCAAVGAEALGVDEIIFSPLNVGVELLSARTGLSLFRLGNSGVVGGGSGLFVWTAGRIGYAYGRGNREDAGFALRGVSGDEDREVRLWSGIA